MDEQIDPMSNVIEFTRRKREPLFKMQPAGYHSCKHVRVFVNQEKRSVSCQECDVSLDPFQVLWEMAMKERGWLTDLESWEAMRDSRLSDRYDAEWQRHIGDVIAPPSDPNMREIWNTFHACLGDKFCAMFKRKRRKTKGPEWYGRDARGCTVSLEYARSQLISRVVPVQQTSTHQPAG